MKMSTSQIVLLIAANVLVAMNRVEAQQNETSTLLFLTEDELKKVDAASYSYVDRLTQLEEGLYAKGIRIKENSTLFAMAKFKQPSKAVIELFRESIKFTETIRILKNDFFLTEDEIGFNLENCTFGPGCLPDPVCPKSDKYRTINGSCNSLVKKLRNLGRSVTGYRRLLKPAYDDGFSTPRQYGVSGSELPSPRLISAQVFSNTDVPLINVTNLLMQFGQLINHDMEFTSQFTFKNGEGIVCCGSNNTPLNPANLSSHCLPITIPVNDPQLRNPQEGCMNFVRSSTGPNRISCNLPFVNYAEQLNQNSHWLDASVVYGSNDDTMNNLRDPLSGLMKTYPGRQLLPTDISGFGFMAGDSRVNEQPELTLMHTIWLREHNRIAKYLAKLNPVWSSETVFQETRRIVIAELQHITYNEFLPTLLGLSGMNRNKDLRPLTGSRTIPYSRKMVSGPVSNEFAAAAFRMGHSLVQGNIKLYDASGHPGTPPNYQMQNFFNNPFAFLFGPTFIDDAIRGLVSQTSQTVDTKIVDDLRLNLFQTGSGYPGPTISSGILDIVALNIQRGRDHGLPSYNRYREYCGLPALNGSILSLPTSKTKVVTDCDPIIPYFDPSVVTSLDKIYQSVDDIDLFVGGIAEINPLDDILVGPTFMCIIAENFKQLKFTDRYFYESSANPYPFTPAQLTQIKTASMARILCDNNDGSVKTMQTKAFSVPGGTNRMRPCTDAKNIPVINLDLWKA